MLKPLVPMYRYDLSVHLRDIAEKTGPRETETDSSLPANVTQVQFLIHNQVEV